MKLLLLLFIFAFIACNSHTPSSSQVQSKKSDTTAIILTKPVLDSVTKYVDSPSNKEVSEDDTVYYVEDFLIECTKEMKFDFIDSKHPTQSHVSKGDTIYHTKRYTILGNRKEIRGWGVYKKFPSKIQFSSFNVLETYKGVLAKPDFNTDPEARYFRTKIREGCSNNGLNFAGHYTIAQWGCGLMCTSMAIVDRITGRIYFSHIPFEENDGYYGADFQDDSRMVIINSYLLDDHKGYYACLDYMKPEIYEWRDSVFKRVYLPL